jgi:phenylpropionate dioxygenase-like ring-hydroxylating dioxygenase large terminal subunit
MGELWRRFWLPFMMSSELPAPDCPPKRVRILSEDLVAFRDTAGRVGLLGNHCPHRGASLFFGCNQEGGLRCVYHGWKYDVHGRCIEMPNEPASSTYKDKIQHKAYPCREAGGFIWAYMGPASLKPRDLPRFGFNVVPEKHRLCHKLLVYCNWLQAMEGDVDPAHVSFLHGNLAGPANLPWRERLRVGGSFGSSSNNPSVTTRNLPDATQDIAPAMFVKETDYGLAVGARRRSGADSYFWRINQFLMPGNALIPAPHGANQQCTMRIPIDDDSSWNFRVRWNDHRPLTAEELEDYTKIGINLPEVDPMTFVPVENKDNDYLIDRSRQGAVSMTGIKSISQQDRAATESMGPIYDRTQEHLCTTDAGVIALRKILLRAVRDLQQGVEPAQPANAAVYHVRAPEIKAARDVPFDQLVEEYVLDVTRL